MAGFSTIASVLSIGGSIIGGLGRIYGGAAEKASDYKSAADLENYGRAEFAASQREALDVKFQGDLVQSRQRALAAASGGGAADEGMLVIADQTAARERYAIDSVIFKGADTRKRYFDAARAKRESGDSSLIGGVLGGIGYTAGGIGSWASSIP